MIQVGKIGIVAHDAGGAEIISSWIRRNHRDHVAVLGGPAENIFHKKTQLFLKGVLMMPLTAAAGC